jgi:hypothetical protein
MSKEKKVEDGVENTHSFVFHEGVTELPQQHLFITAKMFVGIRQDGLTNNKEGIDKESEKKT